MTATKPSLSAAIREALGPRPPRPAPPTPPAVPVRGVARAKKRRPDRPVDELARYWPDRPPLYLNIPALSRDALDEASVETLEPYAAEGKVPASSRPAPTVVRPKRPAPRGPAEILAYLARRGITIIPTIDGNLAVMAEAGRLDVAIRDAITASLPLLRAYLHGTPLRCALPAHVGAEPPEAGTLVTGGAAACAECVP